MLLQSETKNHLNVSYSIYSYLKAVREMRSPEWRDPDLGLFELAYTFRHRKLSRRLDRVYAFRGLLKEQSSLKGEAAVMNYGQEQEHLWLTLSRETMVEHQTLLPLVLAERTTSGNVQKSSWFLDFSMNHNEPNRPIEVRSLFWSGGLDDPVYYPLQVNDFCAAGGLKAQVSVDAELPSVISVKGFVCDDIVSVGSPVGRAAILLGRPNYVKLFKSWETLVGGPWPKQLAKPSSKDVEHLGPAEKFALTITGGVWTEAPLDWQHCNTRDHSQRFMSREFFRAALANELEELGPNKDKIRSITGYDNDRRHQFSARSDVDNVEYERLRDDACESRRLAVFRSGKFGLVSEFAQVGDKLVVLFGCDVPLVLHMDRSGSNSLAAFFDVDEKGKLYHDLKASGKIWALRGQAYVHELMHYPGDLESDIANGSINLETFMIG